MVARAAGGEVHRPHPAEDLVRARPERGFQQVVLGEPAFERLRDRTRLLVDLLLHEVSELSALDRVRRQLALTHRSLHDPAVSVADRDGLASHLGDLAFL